MSITRSYVDGTELVDLILEVRLEFLRRAPFELDDSRRPNSVRLVAVDLLARKTEAQRQSIVREIDAVDVWLGEAEPGVVFAQAETPREMLTDLTCEVVTCVLRRDPSILTEDERRLALAKESGEELDEDWWSGAA